MENLTVAYLEENFSNPQDAFNYIYALINDARKDCSLSNKPVKPTLPIKHTTEDVKVYAEKLALYETEKEAYDNKREAAQKIENDYYRIGEDYIKSITGLNTIVPQQYRDKLYSKAYEDGHSYGLNEVYIKLNNLIEIFE